MDATTLRNRVASLSDARRRLLAEQLAAAHDAPSTGRLVAFIEAGSSAPSHTDLRAFLGRSFPEHMVPTAFVVLDHLPRTPGGKVDVRALPAVPAAPSSPESFVAPESTVERQLADIWSQVLGGVRVGVHDNFFEIGGDSILSIQIVARAARAGIRLAPDQLFLHQTVAELARVAVTGRPVTAEQGPVGGPVPLTPIQHWFRELSLPRPAHWHHVLWTEAPVDVDAGLLSRALGRLLAHHDALRLRFATDSDWTQSHGPVDSVVPVREVDFEAVPEDELARALTDAADALAADTDLIAGPPVSALVSRRGSDPPRVALAIHHLVVDPLSWQVLLEDLDVVYTAFASGTDPVLPARTTSFLAWSNALAAHAATDRLHAELEYWSRVHTDVGGLPRDLDGEFTEGSAHTITTSLDVRRTRALYEDVPPVYGTKTDEVLLAALAGAFRSWTGQPRLLVGLERHGREPIVEGMDLSRTVGWFTAFFPVLLSLEDAAGPGAALKAVKEQLRGVPGRGAGYGMLRYLSPRANVRTDLRRADPQVILNYAGRSAFDTRTDVRFRPIGPPGASRDPANGRSCLLEVNAFVDADRLRFDWTYSADVHHAPTVADLAARFIDELTGLIEHCAQPGAGGLTPSDFPEAGLSQSELDRFLGGLA